MADRPPQRVICPNDGNSWYQNGRRKAMGQAVQNR